MPDFVKSEEQFKRENFPYPKPQEQIGHELWLAKVTNPSTGTYYQLQICLQKIDISHHY